MMEDLTVLLDDWVRGKPGALEQLLPHVYPDLHAIARGCLRRGARPITLQTTAVVNDLFVKLLTDRPKRLESRRHFFVLAAKVIRLSLGCTAEETAELMGLSKATVDRRGRLARAWLFRRLQPVAPVPPETA